jgi:hypothetical protein
MMAIAVVFCHANGSEQASRPFDDFDDAVRYALRSANGYGLTALGPEIPTEVRLVEDDETLLAIKVIRGGLLPQGDRRPSAM